MDNQVLNFEIDQEELYSRQTFTYGRTAMKKIKELNILILGFPGVYINIL
jgi:hypothetical protein